MATKAKRTTRWLLKKEVKYLISRGREVDAVALEEFVIKSVLVKSIRRCFGLQLFVFGLPHTLYTLPYFSFPLQVVKQVMLIWFSSWEVGSLQLPSSFLTPLVFMLILYYTPRALGTVFQ